MLSPLRYPGGKAKLFSYFAELVSRNGFYDYTYCEPYAGGAGLALKLLSHGFVAQIEINDIDPAIAAFWRSILKSPQGFCERIADVELSVAEWERQREVYRAGPIGSDLELGFAAYYLNRTSRSGIIEGSGPIGGYAQAGNWTIDARFNRRAQISQIGEIACFSDMIKVSQVDALDFMAGRMAREKTFIYLDPPYYVKGSKLYKNFYVHEDHVRIARELEAHRDCAWVLSYDCAGEILEMYKSFEPFIYQLQYSAGRPGFGSEVIFAGSSVALPEKECLRRAA